MNPPPGDDHRRIIRRRFLGATAAMGVVGTGYLGWRSWQTNGGPPVVIIKAQNYRDALKQKLLDGLKALSFGTAQVSGRKVLLKPNLVEPRAAAEHINTHPMLILAAIESFRSLGAASVTVAEGAGHVRDPYFVLEESGLLEPLAEDRTPFIDLNFAPVKVIANAGGMTSMRELALPQPVLEADIVVSLAKMKTHHWTGATLTMKNLFGVMPGSYYGWPKNVLHRAGIPESILDIYATLRPQLGIVDGIVGMGGDGPIMGTPVQANVLVMGTNLPAVDSTCARVMGLRPEKIEYLQHAGNLGPIDARQIDQRGERVETVRHDFPLLDFIPAHKSLREGRPA